MENIDAIDNERFTQTQYDIITLIFRSEANLYCDMKRIYNCDILRFAVLYEAKSAI